MNSTLRRTINEAAGIPSTSAETGRGRCAVAESHVPAHEVCVTLFTPAHFESAVWGATEDQLVRL